jgi:hypothetical protein
MNWHDLREQLAASEQERWAHWQRYLHGQCVQHDDGSLTIPTALVARWERQSATPYDQTLQRGESRRPGASRALLAADRSMRRTRIAGAFLRAPRAKSVERPRSEHGSDGSWRARRLARRWRTGPRSRGWRHRLHGTWAALSRSGQQIAGDAQGDLRSHTVPVVAVVVKSADGCDTRAMKDHWTGGRSAPVSRSGAVLRRVSVPADAGVCAATRESSRLVAG